MNNARTLIRLAKLELAELARDDDTDLSQAESWPETITDKQLGLAMLWDYLNQIECALSRESTTASASRTTKPGTQ